MDHASGLSQRDRASAGLAIAWRAIAAERQQLRRQFASGRNKHAVVRLRAQCAGGRLEFSTSAQRLVVCR